ncbi:hypothetical protein SESBI_28611 [Sesbania bispinosa]|nr:hypothetical protein SESBI_28611 [Sesbania bispinosa]
MQRPWRLLHAREAVVRGGLSCARRCTGGKGSGGARSYQSLQSPSFPTRSAASRCSYRRAKTSAAAPPVSGRPLRLRSVIHLTPLQSHATV